MDFDSFSRAYLSRGRRCVVLLRRLESSHALARRMVEEHLADEVALPAAELLAWEQTGGVGRGGRRWSSPAGAGVWATLIRSSMRADLQLLPTAVAVALCEAARQHVGPVADRCGIKWPNDVVVTSADGRGGAPEKLAGILIDTFSRKDRAATAIVSFGLNWTADLASLDAPRPTSIGALGGEADLATVAHDTVAAVSARLDALEREADTDTLFGDEVFGHEAAETADDDPSTRSGATAAATLADRYSELSIHCPGDRIRVRDVEALPSGDESAPQTVDSAGITGHFLGFDPRGLLRLEVDGRERLFAAGTVEPAPDAGR